MTDRPARRFLPSSLHGRLILFSALLTACVVLVAFVFAIGPIRRGTHELLSEELRETERIAIEHQRRLREVHLRTSGLVTENPTLRAALETYRLETMLEESPRADLLTTIQHEVGKIAMALDDDFIVVTDEAGLVLAAVGPDDAVRMIGREIAALRVVRHALEQSEPVGEKNFAVLALGADHVLVSCVPIVLQGYIIGTLMQGDRLDGDFVGDLQATLGGHVIVTVGDEVAAASLPASSLPPPSTWTGPAGPGAEASPGTTWPIDGESFVGARLLLGRDDRGRPVEMHLLRSLAPSLSRANRSLAIAFATYGTAAVLVAGVLAVGVSHSTLRPLNRFVAFMRGVAGSGDLSLRPEAEPGAAEVETLRDAYDQLMTSLASTRQELSGAREDLARLDRLKEAEKMAALGRMLSGAAHEINNPLSAIVGYSELLLRRGHLEEDVRRRVESVHRESKRVSALVKNLLKLSRRSDDQRRLIDLNDVVRESLALCAHDLKHGAVTLSANLSPEPVQVLANELELQQVVINIVRNAMDAMQEAGGPASIEIGTRLEAGEAVVRIADSGPGMKDPARVFDPFYTTKEIGKGTGLGLAICHGIIDAHGGKIGAANRPQGGAEFTMRFTPPAAAQHAGAAAPAANPDPRGPSPAARLEVSILLIDDEPAVLGFQADLLEGLGARVTQARNGVEALRALEARDFDLVVTDLRMPGGVSGQDLYRWIEANRAERSGRVIFITGDTMDEESHGFLSKVPNGRLVKPFSVTEYVTLLQEVLHADSRQA